MDIASYFVFFSVVACIYAISVLGLNLQWGFTGIMNIGVVGFFGVGAYAAALITGPDYPDSLGGLGLPPVIGYLGAIAASGIVALFVGLVTIRLRHDFLAVATFGVAICIQMLAMNLKPLTRGFDGLHSLPRPFTSMATTPFQSNLYFLIMVLVVGGALLWALERLVRSPWGRVLRAIREDEEASAALGKNAVSFRLQTFVLGSMLMGLSGALYASFMGFVSPQDLLPIVTFQIFVMLIVGGSGNNFGAILGTVTIWALWTMTETVLGAFLPPDLQRQASAIRVVFVGFILVVMLLYRPQGLLPERRSDAASKEDRL